VFAPAVGAADKNSTTHGPRAFRVSGLTTKTACLVLAGKKSGVNAEKESSQPEASHSHN
jgi:hypothetical protein